MLDELERLAREATPPPWYAEVTGDYCEPCDVDRCDKPHHVTAWIQQAFTVDTNELFKLSRENAAYIAALVNAAPLLLAAVRAAEAYLEYVPDPIACGPAKHSAHAVAAIELRSALAALKGSP